MSEVIQHVRDSVVAVYEADPNSEPVFKRSELYQMFQSRLIAHGASHEFAQKAQCTRMSDEIIESIPGPTKTKHEGTNLVALIIDTAFGKAIFDACYTSVQDTQYHISRIVQTIRKEMSNSRGVFDGDVSIKRQKESVPSLLIQLLSVILEGEKSRYRFFFRIRKDCDKRCADN